MVNKIRLSGPQKYDIRVSDETQPLVAQRQKQEFDIYLNNISPLWLLSVVQTENSLDNQQVMFSWKELSEQSFGRYWFSHWSLDLPLSIRSTLR